MNILHKHVFNKHPCLSSRCCLNVVISPNQHFTQHCVLLSTWISLMQSIILKLSCLLANLIHKADLLITSKFFKISKWKIKSWSRNIQIFVCNCWQYKNIVHQGSRNCGMRKPKKFEEKPALVLICPPQISHDLNGDWTRVSAIWSQHLPSWSP
jgi:hypothetical protein